MLALTTNFFELLGLPQQFALDDAELAQRWRKLQAQVHPDKFASQGAPEKRLAMQAATHINEAYQTLRQPLKRAEYLCRLHAVDLQLENNTAMPVAFLMQQIDWRERLEEARQRHAVTALYAMQTEVESYLRQQQQQLATQLDLQHDYLAAAVTLRQLLFVEKIAQEIKAAFAELED